VFFGLWALSFLLLLLQRGRARADFAFRLSFSWPQRPQQRSRRSRFSVFDRSFLFSSLFDSGFILDSPFASILIHIHASLSHAENAFYFCLI
jgi:hypothetical protein